MSHPGGNREDYIGLAFDDLPSKFRVAVALPLSRIALYQEVLTLDEPQPAQFIQECRYALEPTGLSALVGEHRHWRRGMIMRQTAHRTGLGKRPNRQVSKTCE